MNIYTNKLFEFSEYKVELNITDTSISIKYYLKKPWILYEDGNFWTDSPVFENTIPLTEVRRDTSTEQLNTEPHMISVFLDRFRNKTMEAFDPNKTSYGSDENTLNLKGKRPIFVDASKRSMESKSGVKEAARLHDGVPLLLFLIPFNDSPVEDWTIISEANETYLNGELIVNPIDVNYLLSLKEVSDKFLPSITLSKEGNEITATLVPAKANVQLYFENTVGTLSALRATTDVNGKAKTTITSDAPGKVKVGFKYFSGKNEILV